MNKTRSLTRLAEMDEPITRSLTVIRLDFDEDEVSPQQVRGILGKFGQVHAVSIFSDRDVVYGLADMADIDAKEAVDGLYKTRWRGVQVLPTFAARALGRAWSSHHAWKPPK